MREDPGGETSIRVRGAVDGDRESLEWVVERFTPFLIAQAERRLRPSPQRLCDPEDLVQQVWVIALPKLSRVTPRGDRMTPVLLSFLGTILLRSYAGMAAKAIRRQQKAEELAPRDPEGAALTTAVFEKVARRDRSLRLVKAMKSLDEPVREVLVLRAMEQLGYRDIAERMGCTVGAAKMRYQRALKGLRDAFPADLLDELEAESS